jgi:hypothetical protein
MLFAQALQKAGKPFRMMLYPKGRHAIIDPAQVKHMRAMMADFVFGDAPGAGAISSRLSPDFRFSFRRVVRALLLLPWDTAVPYNRCVEGG